ncbi:DsbA family oxidoreductase [Pseudovibrio sp. SPO723]|uniref:DsbA family oxidoreductase n=1 Tax=Nesiotobacter zosterae TaxID=392721 RepID=UPI0029C4F314|nr:DsbA family oxidoreductase [Pseudovibrio sp. SPO723]MDX5592857.1 DsbA family oxidoreductase [Pseudovibrio sp. SPO723]
MFGPVPLKVSVISDVMCPWCYIGKRRFEKALALVPDIKVETTWLPFQLDSTLPAEGKDRQLYLSEKFGGAEQAKDVYSRIEAAGQQEEIPFAFDKITKSPNTLNAHRLILWAQENDRQEEMVEALFQAFFIDGKDLSRIDTLSEIAGDAGLESEAIRRRLESDEDLANVSAAVEQASVMGVTGVPFFVVDNRFGISGAEQPETIAAALMHADQTRSLS